MDMVADESPCINKTFRYIILKMVHHRSVDLFRCCFDVVVRGHSDDIATW